MKILRIPLTVNEPHQRAAVLLSGVRYRIALDWNGRIGRWIVGLTHADSGRAIFSGRILATRADLLRLYRFSPDCPAGTLFAYDAAGLDREASFTTLGLDDGVILLYAA